MIKIAFLGTHSTGKTTRAKTLSKEKGYILVTEAARSCPLPVNRKASRSAQLYIFSTQLRNEIEQMAWAEKTGAPGIVCDRSIVDSLIYSADRGYSDLVDMLTPLARKWLKTYTKLYWCRPKPGTVPTKDKFRETDPLWQLAIDAIFERMLGDVFGIYPEILL